MGRALRTFKQHRKMLIEMPLPKGMAPDALVPKDKGKQYSSQTPAADAALSQHGSRIATGSSRVAYHVKVESEQFGRGGTLGLDVVNGMAETVIKLAYNAQGLAQNEEEIKVYKKFKKYELLLPIIDTSENHRKKVLLGKKDTSSKQINNWLQMPYAFQPDDEHFNHIFNEYFGDLTSIINGHDEDYDEDEDDYPPYSHEQLRTMNIPMLNDIASGKMYGANSEQKQHLKSLLELVRAGLKIGDLSRTDNWGVFQNRPVILDYGFTNNTSGLYNGAKMAEGKIDDEGNLRLIIT